MDEQWRANNRHGGQLAGLLAETAEHWTGADQRDLCGVSADERSDRDVPVERLADDRLAVCEPLAGGRWRRDEQGVGVCGGWRAERQQLQQRRRLDGWIGRDGSILFSEYGRAVVPAGRERAGHECDVEGVRGVLLHAPRDGLRVVGEESVMIYKRWRK